MQQSLRTRLILLFITVAIIPVLIVGIIVVERSVVAQTQQATANQNEVASKIALQVAHFIEDPESQMQQLITVREIQSLPREQLRPTFSDLMSFSKIYNKIILTDRFGNIIAQTSRDDIFFSGEVLGNLRNRPEFETPLATGQVYYGDVEFNATTGDPFMYLSVPVIDLQSGDVQEVLIAELRFKTMWTLMSDVSTNGENVYLIDPTDRVIAHSNPSIVLQRQKFSHPFVGTRMAGLDGTDSVIGIAPVDLAQNVRFYVIAELPASQALSLSYNLMLITGVALGITIIMTTIFALWQASLITRPVESLAKTASTILAGNLDARAEITTRDEIGTLGQIFNQMTTQLQDLLGQLEQRISERTQALENQSKELEKQSLELAESNKRNEKRAQQFETISTVMRSVASIRNLNDLLQQITMLISERFGYYHVGIFLSDEVGEYAILSATNSEGGQRMLARGHRLKVGQIGIVGFVTGTGKPRIALDVGDDAVFFNNPDLPATRSEMALPLKAGSQIIGALDVQSVEPNAFSQEDIDILSTLADQVSIAIQNSRLFESTQKALADAEATARKNIREQWSQVTKRQLAGYKYTVVGSHPIDHDLENKEVEQALQSGKLHLDEDKDVSGLAVPIILRGEIIGVLNVRTPRGKKWKRNELDVVQAVADRVAISAENARLLEESQKRAVIEQTIGEISSKIGSSINLRNVLQTAVEEMGRIIPGSEVTIQLQQDQSS